MTVGPNDVGRKLMLDVMFHNTPSPSATWYIGLIDNDTPTPAPVSSETMVSHAGWAETVPYSDATRIAWQELAATGTGFMTNTTTSDFNINATETVYGIFLVDDSAKSGTAGTLFATAAFSGGPQAVTSGDVLKVTLSITLT